MTLIYNKKLNKMSIEELFEIVKNKKKVDSQAYKKLYKSYTGKNTKAIGCSTCFFNELKELEAFKVEDSKKKEEPVVATNKMKFDLVSEIQNIKNEMSKDIQQYKEHLKVIEENERKSKELNLEEYSDYVDKNLDDLMNKMNVSQKEECYVCEEVECVCDKKQKRKRSKKE